MRTRPAALLLVILLQAGCPGGPRPDTGPRARPGPPADAEEKAERALQAAEGRAARHSRNLEAWKQLAHAAHQAGQPHRYLLALEKAEARGRLPRSLRPRLAGLLHLRAQVLTRLGAPFWFRPSDLERLQWVGAPAAALKTLRRAERLRPSTGKQRRTNGALMDRLRLQLADRLLYTDQPQKALQTYRAQQKRGVLDGEALHWRLAATGATTGLVALSAALPRLVQHAPGAGRSLVQTYLNKGGRDAPTLLTALRIATLGTDTRLIGRLEKALVAVASEKVLTTACGLRRRPSSPSCRALQRWAATSPSALARWARLCRRLHWTPGDAAWLTRVLKLQKARAILGLGPLEGLVSTRLARHTAKGLPHHPALARLGGKPMPSRPPGLSSDAAQQSFEAWAAGRKADAITALSQAAAQTLQGGRTLSFARRCRLLRLTRLVKGPAAVTALRKQLAAQDPRYRAHLVKRLWARNELVAALDIAQGKLAQVTRARLEGLGENLTRWGIPGDTTLRKQWTRRYGRSLAHRAWRSVSAGAKRKRTRAPVDYAPIWVLAGQRRWADAEALSRRLWKRHGHRVCFAQWWARIPYLKGQKDRARRRVRQLLHQTPQGFRTLPAALDELLRLGFHREAGKVVSGLYERSFTDPALLRPMARGAVAAGNLQRAGLIFTDWASQSGRPDRVYLTAARWLFAGKRHRAAATYASRAIAWRGNRPLEPTLATLRYLWAANRSSEAGRTVRWLLNRWPAGNGRQGISQTIAVQLLSTDDLKRARPYLTRKRGHELGALLRKKRYAAVQKRAAAQAQRDPLNKAWPTLAALAALQQRQWKLAARHVDQLARLSPRLEPPMRALLLAARGQLPAALATLAQAATDSWGRQTPPDLLAAALASRAGRRSLAAKLLAGALRTMNACIQGPDGRDLTLVRRLVEGRQLPLRIPWAMLLGADSDPGSCEP